MTASTLPTDTVHLCPIHRVPAIPEVVRRGRAEPYLRYCCDLCRDDLCLPFDESFVVGTSTVWMQREKQERGAA